MKIRQLLKFGLTMAVLVLNLNLQLLPESCDGRCLNTEQVETPLRLSFSHIENDPPQMEPPPNGPSGGLARPGGGHSMDSLNGNKIRNTWC